MQDTTKTPNSADKDPAEKERSAAADTSGLESNVKKRCDSHTEHVQIVMYRHTNGSGRLFGGALLEMIDVVGAICARRHAGAQVTTVAIDHLSFRAPAELNSTLLLISEVESVGNTSMKVRVSTFVETLDGNREEINTAYLTYVALDDENRPTRVPRICSNSHEED
ncbi:MAG: acyl-CoA thioesterase [Oscillospiraceae bacterium]|jgi:acyl-CoA hydrolase|nr:acyl-CoA thioesterase [Oscillospiraceae bacterium]